jgi:lysophospholipase L1-like esterase
MRRFLTWVLPIVGALVGVLVFGAGFYKFLTGRYGTPVGVSSPAPRNPTGLPQPPKGVIVPIVLGDSLARGTGDETGLGIGGRLADDLKARGATVKPVVNLAVNGAHSPELLKMLDSHNVRVLLGQANVVIISIGGNDLWGGGTDWRAAASIRDPEAVMQPVLDRITKIVAIVREANPKARIFLIGLYNPFVATPFGANLSAMVTRWNAREAERFAGDTNLTVVPTADIFSHHDRLSFDRFHPSDEGYALIARRIADAL